jgi:polyhydroxyalkanoate synthesis regulator phasin
VRTRGSKERAVTNIQDLRKQLEGSFGNLTPAKAQELAKGVVDRDAAKEQVARLAADLIEWSQRNRARLTSIVRDEVRDQLKQMGVASQEDVDALRKRVRDLERAARAGSAKATAAKRRSTSAAKATTASPRTTAKRRTPPKA